MMECPPFFFHYIILIVCVSFITCVCILKFNYLFWYSQPITFCFTLRRWYKEGRGQGNWQTSIMNPLSLGERYNNAVIYSFVHHVNHDNVTVYGNRGFSIEDAPYQEIASFLGMVKVITVSCHLIIGKQYLVVLPGSELLTLMGD